jgi:hypothetical protein
MNWKMVSFLNIEIVYFILLSMKHVACYKKKRKKKHVAII